MTDTDPAVRAAHVYFGPGAADPLLWATFIAGYMAAACDKVTVRVTEDGKPYWDGTNK